MLRWEQASSYSACITSNSFAYQVLTTETIAEDTWKDR